MKRLYQKLVEGKIFQIIHKRVSRAVFKGVNVFAKALDSMVSFIPRRILSSSTPIDEKKVLFLSYQGDYACNPRGIAEEFLGRGSDVHLTWMTKRDSNKDSFPKELELVQRGSFSLYKTAAEAKVIVDNTHNFTRLGIPKKRGQYLLQTWHGSLGIKRLDGNVVMGRKWKRLAKKAQRDTDFCISNSDFETEVFRTSYWGDTPILPLGHARNDVLLAKEEELAGEICEKVYRSLGIDEKSKIALYAPTHKDEKNESFFELDYALLRDALTTRFGGDWKIVLRFHTRLKKKSSEWVKTLPPYVLDATYYDDMQELLVATDVGITDYSSWIFDYVLQGRPGFILAPDRDVFEEQRSFYYPIEETPFPIAVTNEELGQAIMGFDEKLYQEKQERFLQERGCFEDGNASARIVDKIEELLKQ